MTNNLPHSGSLNLGKLFVQGSLLRKIEQPISNVESKFGLNAVENGFRDERIRRHMSR